MASVSAAHIILFIASIVVAAGVAGTVVLEVGQLSDAIETQGSATSTEIETEIDIINDEGKQSSIYEYENNSQTIDGDYIEDKSLEVTLYVKNTGSAHLDAHESTVDVLFNGQYVSSDQTTLEHVNPESGSWRTGDVVELTVELTHNDGELEGDTSMSVIVNDNEERIDFHVSEE